MGYSKEQIDEKLDDILSFADIGEFAYQPVKTYSSGMFVRLAFAVATSVDPDILIVDEALAVGDMRFHQKCIRRMESFRENNKTIFFVTHDVGMVNRFCTTALWLNDGIIQDLGISERITKKYQSFMVYGSEMTQQARLSNPDIDNSVDLIEHSKIEWVDVGHCDSFGEGGARITHVAFYNAMTGEKAVILRGGEKVRFAVKIKCHASLTLPGLGLALKDPLGYIVFTINNYIYNIDIESFNPGEEYEFFISFNFPNIKNSRYIFVVALSDGTQRNHIQHHWIHDSLEIVVQNDEEPYLLNALLILDKNNIQIESRSIN
jgi:energy-coupling factor transporter ATP-binding protein EcfA2